MYDGKELPLNKRYINTTFKLSSRKQSDTKYARRIGDKLNANDNNFGSRILDLDSRYR